MAQFNTMILKLQEMAYANQRAINKQNLSNQKQKECKSTKKLNAHSEANKKQIKSLSTNIMTTEQINLLGKGLKFIPTPPTNQTQIWRQLLQDFHQFARKMRLQYIFQGDAKDNENHNRK